MVLVWKLFYFVSKSVHPKMKRKTKCKNAFKVYLKILKTCFRVKNIYSRWHSSVGSNIVTDAKRYRVRSWVG